MGVRDHAVAVLHTLSDLAEFKLAIDEGSWTNTLSRASRSDGSRVNVSSRVRSLRRLSLL